MRKEDEWKEECMEEGTEGRVGAEKLKKRREKERIIQRKSQNSSYWLKAAENLLDSDTPQAAIVLGYFAAENKVEEALAHKNYEVNTHLCTIKGLSRVLESPELATQLDRAYQKRKDINYETQLKEDETEAEEFIEERVKPLIQEINSKIEDTE
ncbi:HEPN domain-containing protein [Candidatus Nanohalobium constans]|uniref:Uncharacterized protein n=1 Tax=Candidatus Nanohalobium constans TaxID=2565781 RepID=A0A5Q0UFM1_9ARCH|nr:HEPN domain-containing protein [Candidatus Nanohalobium constans]QGA80171.1 hypothetical protein LC1Nh_0268 [Candidatus Nanohalobium constans]